VRFWRAGLTLDEVFVGIEQQTGVRIALWPSDAPSLNIRVNLYLNPQNPPSVRAIMAQLMWVTDCSFAYPREEEVGRKVTYYLLPTSIGQGLEETVRESEQSQLESEHAEKERRAERNLGRMNEYITALRLSRDELVAQYEERDDHLLLNLLDSRRRGLLEFVSRLPEDELQGMLKGATFERDWSALAAGEQGFWSDALHIDSGWLESHHARLRIESSSFALGAMAMQVLPGGKEENYWPGNRVTGAAQIHVGFAEGPLEEPTDEIALYRLLGEDISPEAEELYVRERREKIAQAEELRRAAAIAQNRRRSKGALSPSAQNLLLNTVLPSATPGLKYLWQVQELVARTSGLNCISDAFCDLPRESSRDSAGAETPVTALQLLTDACEPRPSQPGLWQEWTGRSVTSALEWEWGDAGDFLRFRSTYRGLWRASQIPPDVVAKINAWTDPCLRPGSGRRARPAGRVAVGLANLAWLGSHLTMLQARYGGHLTYGDPADENEQKRFAFRQRVVVDVSYIALYKWVSVLSNPERDRLQQAGVRVADLGPSERLILSDDMFLGWYVKEREGRGKDLVIHMAPLGDRAGLSAETQRYRVWIEKQGKELDGWEVPTVFAMDAVDWSRRNPAH
jgi:hypothetical protein